MAAPDGFHQAPSGDSILPRTPKQRLLVHMAEAHPNRLGRLGRWKKGDTLARLQFLHATLHHRYMPNHYHEGPNTGPDERPPGWKTGEGAVPRVKP